MRVYQELNSAIIVLLNLYSYVFESSCLASRWRVSCGKVRRRFLNWPAIAHFLGESFHQPARKPYSNAPIAWKVEIMCRFQRKWALKYLVKSSSFNKIAGRCTIYLCEFIFDRKTHWSFGMAHIYSRYLNMRVRLLVDCQETNGKKGQ